MLIPRVSRFGLFLAAGLAASLAHGATLVVTTTADSGPGSLRDAINTANGNGSAERDTITFASALADQTIAPTTALPLLQTPQITIDGDLDGDCAPDINLSGASVVPPGLQAGLGISNLGNGAIVRGLAIHSFANVAISLGSTASGATLGCNYFGTDTLGIASLPNGTPMLGHISVATSGHTIGPGNLIVNSRGVGLRVVESSLLPFGDFDFTGLPSDSAPRVYANLSFNDNCAAWVGDGFTPLDGNGRPFRDNFGMRLRGRITVGATGSYDFNFAGIDDQARLVIDGGVVGAPPITFMSATRSATLSAGPHTIEIAFREAIGAARLAPTISGPGSVTLTSDDQSFCPPPAQPGLCAELFQLRIPSTGNRITRNRFRNNAGLGIQLGLCANVNDAGDADTGPNGLLNHPVITGVSNGAGGELLVTGTAPANSTVELFQAAVDPSGFGEGDTFLGQATASAGGNFAISAAVAPAGALTATATDAGNNTSEFGRNFAYSTGALGLYANALSTSSIELTWRDPNLVETGFRIERSTDGTTFAPVGTVGSNVVAHIDTALAANTLYYYRVVATTAAGDAPASNRATASTFPTAAAKVCFDRIPRVGDFATGPALAFDGTHFGMIHGERRPGEDNLDLIFRRYDPATLAEVGSAVRVSDSDMNVGGAPRLVYNGERYGALWLEQMRGPAGALATGKNVFALFERDGTIVRRDVRTPLVQLVNSIPELVWDGTHWGVFTTIIPDPAVAAPLADVAFARLTQTGSPVGGLVYLTASPAVGDERVDAAWSAPRAQHGVAWFRGRDDDWELVFQRFTAGGTPVDAQPVVLESFSFELGSFGLGLLDVLWDGANWAVAYTRDDPTNQVESLVLLRRVDGVTGAPLGTAPTRLSDDAPDSSNVSALRLRPDGGYAVFTQTSGSNFQNEIARVQATPAGVRDGTRTFVSPNDGVANNFSGIAGNGTDFLVATTAPSGAEIFAIRVAADGQTPAQAPVALTSGHTDPDGVPRNPLHVAPLSDGFVAVWLDGPPGPGRINARIYNGAGQVVSTLTPIVAGPARGGLVALASVGNTFALAWKNTSASADVLFARYNASGGPITGERTIATTTGNNAPVAMGWDGETYAVFFNTPGGARLQRVRADGTTMDAAVAIARAPDGFGQVAWLGDSWAMLTRAGTVNGDIEYVRWDAQGMLLDGPVTLTTNAGRPPGNQRLLYNGRALGALWSQWSGSDPPGEDIVFTVLNRDGTKAFTEVPVVASGLPDTQARLYAAGTNFRVVSNGGGFGSGLREVEVTPAGTVAADARFLSNRPSAIGSAAVASNGATQGILYFPSDASGLHFQTNACLADATPPPCPALAASVTDGAVRASWSAVADPESTVIRYNLYRDGVHLAELDGDRTSHADHGFERGATHTYELRALNGAFRESAACATVQVDTDAIFENGYE